MSSENKGILKDKSFDFALRIINLYKYLTNEHKEYILSKQLLRSGTSIGALVRESEYAQSKADFFHKLSIALKEANETEYWLQLLNKSNYINNKMFNSIHKDIQKLLKLLILSTKTLKENS